VPSYQKVGSRTCKPNSVCREAPLAGTTYRRTAIPLGRALLSGSSDLPEGPNAPSRHAPAAAVNSHPVTRTYSDGETPSLFGLAPCGVCPARSITRTAVRSCRTFSPLPPHPALGPAKAVYFLWHFPSIGLDADFPDVIRHTALRSSDFPPSSLDATRAAVRSSCLPEHYRHTTSAFAVSLCSRIYSGAYFQRKT
jgi:hypothetical protein